MKKIVTLLLILTSHFAYSQNLVNNWTFEDTVACPTYFDQIDKAVGWISFSITPEYFNSCAPPNVSFPVSVPHNWLGDQYAHSGNGYAGFTAYNANISSPREYVATQLNQALVVGTKYFLSFWVSTANGYITNQFPDLACNNIGAKFSTMPYSQNNPQPVNNFAHIVDTNIINDTINWVRISGSFIADSNYHYLSIGNFYDNAHSAYVMNGSLVNQAYYYLDDVKLSSDSNFVNSVPEIQSFDMIKIFPNPARDWIVISGNKLKKIAVFDVQGNLCFQASGLLFSTYKINVSLFADGMYFINAKSDDKNFNLKFIINKN